MLVTGQPIFAAERGFVGRFTDYGLPDYRQFGDLARILLSTGHDIVVLTGDVHYGRVAISDLPAGSRLIEVIASPFALVSPLAAGKWGAAPMMFPAGPLPGQRAFLWLLPAGRAAGTELIAGARPPAAISCRCTCIEWWQ